MSDNSRNLIGYICAAILMVYSTVLPQIMAWVFISNKKLFTLATIQHQHLLRFQWEKLSLPDHFPGRVSLLPRYLLMSIRMCSHTMYIIESALLYTKYHMCTYSTAGLMTTTYRPIVFLLYNASSCVQIQP